MERAHQFPERGTDPDIDLIAEFATQADVARSTKVAYRAHLEELRVWLREVAPSDAGDSLLIAATPAQVQRFMGYLRSGQRFAAPPQARQELELSASTRKTYLASMRAFFRYCVAVGILAHDPTASIRSPRVSVTPGLFLDAAELRRLLEVRGTPRERVQTFLMVYTAARSGELRELCWDDVDFPNRVIALHGKGDKVRYVDIHPTLMKELRRWWIHQETHAPSQPDAPGPTVATQPNYVLLTRTGRQLSPTSIYKQLKRRACAAGLYEIEGAHRQHRSQVSPHALRRSFATFLLNEGYALDTVADILGHKSLDTTRKHYAFSSNQRRRNAIEGFNLWPAPYPRSSLPVRSYATPSAISASMQAGTCAFALPRCSLRISPRALPVFRSPVGLSTGARR